MMNSPTFAQTHSLALALCIGALISSLAACSPSAGNASSDDVSPGAEPGLIAQAAADAAAAAAASHPLCDLVTFAEVSAVAGGKFSKLDVIEADDMSSVDCVYLDMSDLYNGLNIRFVTTNKLLATESRWQSAAAYFDEWSRGGKAVAGVGTSAVWTDLLGGLLVLQGDHALLLTAAKLDTANPGARAKMELLARQLIGRLP